MKYITNSTRAALCIWPIESKPTEYRLTIPSFLLHNESKERWYFSAITVHTHKIHLILKYGRWMYQKKYFESNKIMEEIVNLMEESE